MTCSQCGGAAFPVRAAPGASEITGWACQGCGASGTIRADNSTRQLKLSIEPGRAQTRVDPFATEDAAQTAIVSALRRCGYLVLVTSRRRKKLKFQCEACRESQMAKVTCMFCGATQVPWQYGGDGCDAGVPDLLVSTREGDIRFCGLEVKGPKTAVSPEQKALRDVGRIAVVRTVEQALAAVEAAWLGAEEVSRRGGEGVIGGGGDGRTLKLVPQLTLPTGTS